MKVTITIEVPDADYTMPEPLSWRKVRNDRYWEDQEKREVEAMQKRWEEVMRLQRRGELFHIPIH